MGVNQASPAIGTFKIISSVALAPMFFLSFLSTDYLPPCYDCPSDRLVIDFDSSDKDAPVDDGRQKRMHVVGIGLDLKNNHWYSS